MDKNLLILKAHDEVCGNEVGLITHQAGFFGMGVKEEEVDSPQAIKDVFERYKKIGVSFDFVYLCSHANSQGFDIKMGAHETSMRWSDFGKVVCESGTLTENTVFLLACCQGGLFNVATDLFAVCESIKYVCGAKWKLRSADLATGFAVFLYNMAFKRAEPSYAAQKATQATDYTFACHDRAEIESHPQFENRRDYLYHQIGWTDEFGEWIIPDEVREQYMSIESK